MSNFPQISIETGSGDTMSEIAIFRLGIPAINEEYAAVLQGVAELLRLEVDERITILQQRLGGAYSTLATAVAACANCPVKNRKIKIGEGDDDVCTGFRRIDFIADDLQTSKPILIVSGVNAYTYRDETAHKQIEGNLCGITAAMLNQNRPVKM